MEQFFFAWLHWNPERTLFTVPFIDRPVVWYGVWFVFGFLIGYITLVPMFKRRLDQVSTLSERDVISWQTLVEDLSKKEADPITQRLSKKNKHELTKLKKGQRPDAVLRTALLEALNGALRENFNNDRHIVEKLFSRSIASTHDIAQMLVDKLAWFAVAGTIVGARLGHVFFYEWPRYFKNPFEIVEVWKGGLASHGAAVGIIIALLLYNRMIRKQFPEFSFIAILDMIVVPTAFAGCCIRIGNFFNQEILGNVTQVPWAIVFDDPADRTMPAPRHPVQLYEATAYIASFFLLYYLWEKKADKLRPGVLSGLFFILIFTSRFLFEFLKMPLSSMINESFLQTGQYLSLPFIMAGIYLLMRKQLLSQNLTKFPNQIRHNIS